MFGSKNRIGGISPSVMEIVPHDFFRVAPGDVGLVGITANIAHWDDAHFDDALKELEYGAGYLGSRDVDFIIHFGAPVVASRGPGYGKELIRLVERAGRTPATTSIVSACHALRYIHAQNIVIVSPYPAAINVNIKKYILSEGFNVLELATADVPFLQLHAKTPDEIADLCIGVIEKYSDLDALYVPCPQWQAMDAVKKIEEKTGVTVIASDPADFWVAFKHLGIQAVSEEYGHLLSLL
tara:strand:+ start:102 stop:818 length:717 start_codon:yes stop_codon:yes gene_type:complete